MTLSEIKSKLDSGQPIDIKAAMVACHPDHNPGSVLAESLFKRLSNLRDGASAPVETIKSPRRTYSLGDRIAVGDASDVYHAFSEGESYILKASRVVGGDALLDNERKAVSKLMKAAKDAGGSPFGRMVPSLVESFPVRDKIQKRVSVFARDEGWFPAEYVHDLIPMMEPVHLAWMFNRMLDAIGFAHSNGIIHASIVPCHVLINPQNHGVRLIGWTHSLESGRITSAPSKYLPWYPPEAAAKRDATRSTDIFMAARFMSYMASGLPDTFPDACPKAMSRFFRSCTLASQSARPSDAWKLKEEFKDVLADIYGPPKFHELKIEA